MRSFYIWHCQGSGMECISPSELAASWSSLKIFSSAPWLMIPVNTSQFQNEPPRKGTSGEKNFSKNTQWYKCHIKPHRNMCKNFSHSVFCLFYISEYSIQISTKIMQIWGCFGNHQFGWTWKRRIFCWATSQRVPVSQSPTAFPILIRFSLELHQTS